MLFQSGEFADMYMIHFLYEVDTTSKAAFAHATYELTEQLKVSAGVRYTKDHKERTGNALLDLLVAHPRRQSTTDLRHTSTGLDSHGLTDGQRFVCGPGLEPQCGSLRGADAIHNGTDTFTHRVERCAVGAEFRSDAGKVHPDVETC